MIGDGFGGRLWYRPTNYTVGSYSAFRVCYSDLCDSGSNQLFGWGGDYLGELGNGPSPNCSAVPIAIPGMNNVRYVTSGYLSAAIKNDGTGWIWVDNGWFGFPTQVISDAIFVDVGITTATFVKEDGTVWSIVDNQFGQFGDGTALANYTTPVQMTGVSNAVRVAVGEFATYVLLTDSTVLAVGSSYLGLLGDPALTDTLYPLAFPIPELNGIIDVKANTVATAALAANGDVYCWGAGGYTGDGDFENDSIPEPILGIGNIVAISSCADGVHFLALDAYGNCYAWGDLNYGSQVTGVPILSQPALVATNVVDIMAGERFSYIAKNDGSLWAAGWSFGCSIWLNLPDTVRTEFTLLDPSLLPGSCPLVGTFVAPYLACDSLSGALVVNHYGGQVPYLYDIGNGPQTNPLFIGVAEGNYSITVTDANGCVTTVVGELVLDGQAVSLPDTLCIGSTSCTSSNIYIPTAFSPNASGRNDLQCVYGADCIATMLLQVFDRWGNKVFESTDPKACWDGTYKGQALDPAVFVYHLIATMINGELMERQGNITLVR